MMISAQTSDIKCNENIQHSITFWNKVSTIYETNELTTHDSDAELDAIYLMISTIGHVKTLACFGVADGSRDPKKILDFMKEKEIKLPESMILNDLSPKLLDVCKTRLSDINIPTMYQDGPMDQMINWLPKDESWRSWYIIGSYSAEYIEKSLEIYKKNREGLWNTFDLAPLIIVDSEIKRNEVLNQNFKVEDYKTKMDEINNMAFSKGFIGYSIKADSGFISHYYTVNGMKEISKLAFTKAGSIESYSTGDRYIITVIKKSNDNPNCLITTLNNVIGNIPHELLLTSLRAINKSFF